MQQLPLSKIPGVGKVTAKRLEEVGLITCADVQQYDLAQLLKRFGKFGRVLWERCQGIDRRGSRRSGCANRWGWSARWRKTFTTGKTAKR